MRTKLTWLFSLIAIMMVAFTSCSGESEDIEDINKQTILIFMPWSGNLYETFQENLDSIESAIVANKGLTNTRVMLFLSGSTQGSELSEIVYRKDTKTCERIALKQYSGADYTTAEGIADILNEVKSHAEALNYAMIIGCHGTGWTYKDAWINYPFRAPRIRTATAAEEKDPEMSTRFYGATENPTFETDISELAKGIASVGIKMQYILFDDCYMGNIETAYELRQVTNFLIASTSEVMRIGMPYRTMWNSLCSTTPNYTNAANAFLTFYKNYTSAAGVPLHYGTLSVIDCREMDKVAEIMKDINKSSAFDENRRDNIQRLDGFNPVLFYDFVDYVESFCEDPLLLEKMKKEVNTLVRTTVSTDSLYTDLRVIAGMRFLVPETNCGITVSDPSIHPVAQKSHTRTSWYQATH